MQHLDEGTLVAFVDGETDSARRIRVDQHLASCYQCRAKVAQMEAARDRARTILRSAAPVGGRPDFADVLERRRAPKPVTRPRPIAWAATIVLAIGIGWYARELSQPRPAEQAVAIRPTSPPPSPPQAPPAPPAPPPVASAPVTAPRDTPLAQVAVVQVPAGPARSSAVSANADEAKRAARPADLADRAPAGQVALAPPANAPRRVDSTGTSVTQASDVLGRAPLKVPDLDVLGYAVQGDRVTVTQRLPSGATLELTEQRALGAARIMAKELEGGRLQDEATPVVVVDGIEVRATGPITPDSLGALLRTVK